MEFLSILAGLDNLRKLAVILGLALMGIGVFYPLQKSLQLEEKQINLTRLKKIDSLEIKNLNSDVNIYTPIQATHANKLHELRHEKDSLFQSTLNDAIKFKITILENEIIECQKRDDAEVKDLKLKLSQIQTALIKEETLEEQITSVKSYLTTYRIAEFIAIIGGAIMLGFGLRGWRKSEKESDELKHIQIQIQKEELKKRVTENSKTP